MNKLFSLSLVLVVFLPTSTWGQSHDPIPKPTPPLISPMPDNTAWTIKVTHRVADTKPVPGTRRAEEVINTKSGATRELVTVWSDGSRSDLWFFNGYRLEQNPGSDLIRVTALRGGTDPQDADFTDFYWIDLANYVGTESKNSLTCFFFKAKVKLKYQRITLDYSADIDVKTKMPVAWEVGSNHFDLVSTVPATISGLPPAFAAALKTYQVAAASAHSYKPVR